MPTPKRHDSAAARQRDYRRRRKLARLSSPSPESLPGTASIAAMPSTARWKALRHQAEAALQTLFEEMEIYQEQRSESWQEGDKGQAFQEALDKLEEAIDAVKSID
jgi:hypothetical protein